MTNMSDKVLNENGSIGKTYEFSFFEDLKKMLCCISSNRIMKMWLFQCFFLDCTVFS